ncbi:ATP-grasp domain-containing protein [Mucilaginibacter polytrichastri]|uniref:PylC N-terminal domain-containing protein n=1 Tax=Mucilaginibacter polytrichastri TaxID=1302689 RepID=A0A1Q5ZX45_9SPHI|nr:hypothetical protein [Mucilaginibacter polytrichastri]OKS86345.1 hypothetical protein RG47T_1799 [Mucilaginibacter polytrichastri]SFT21061.1 hypothetical protein SAMN04487890_11763 [Mucilaginibacter polytrichastri]
MIVLITAASTAKAYQVKGTITAGEILLGDYEELPQVMINAGKMIILPSPKSAAYIHEMLALCLDKNITVIYPLRNIEMQLLKEAQLLYDEYGININYVADGL